MPKSCKDPLTVPVRMILSNFLHFWMHRTTSFCRNHASRDVVIGNPKNQSAALRQIVAWGGKKWLRILAIRQGRSLGAAWPFAASAQQPAMPVVGFLSGRSLASDSDLVAVFRQALSEAGYVNGQNVAIEFRWADGQLDRLPELAAELIERKVAVIFEGAADVAAGALRVAAATVPVVLATGSDPVAAGLVASLNRPGGNLTGVTGITNALWPKRLELLRELISPTPLIALLVNPNNLTTTPAARELKAAARRIGQDVVVLNASAKASSNLLLQRWPKNAPAPLSCQTTRCS
jgi:putative ABC transport system substrate-binding protein